MEKLPLGFCIAILIGLAACGRKEEPQSPPAPAASPSVNASVPSPAPSLAALSPAEPAGTPVSKSVAPGLARAAQGTRNVRFGDKFRLDGALVTRDGDGAKVDLYWESLAGQPLTYSVLVHVVDERGDILNQLDHPQDVSARTVKAGETWEDPIRITAGQLKAGNAVAIGVYHPGGDILRADRGKRDWNNVRLWIPLADGR